MRTVLYFFISAIILFGNSSCIVAQKDTSEKQIVSMLNEYYMTHNKIWVNKPPFSPEILESKLDSLQSIYCTELFRIKAMESLEEGFDALTNDQGTGDKIIQKFSITKNLPKPNSYVVSYYSSNIDPFGNYTSKKIILNVLIVNENDQYKIASVW